MPKREYARSCKSVSAIVRTAKPMMPLLVIAVLSVSLVSIAITAAEEATPDVTGCTGCHADIEDIAANFETSLHHTNEGMILEWQKGAGDFCGLNATEYFEEKKCFGCHIESCDRCHKDFASYPGSAEHGKEVGMETCDECHGAKRVASHFMGDWANHKKAVKKGPNADVHYDMGMTCMDCHKPSEIHGDGTEYTHELLAVKISCEDCHANTTDIPSHTAHGEKLDCTACHVGWYQNCINCHADTKKIEGATIDDFNLGIAADGQVKPFYHMTTVCPDNRTHSAYFEFMPHTITKEAKDCAFCHRNEEVLCEGCEGQLLGPEGASFISSEKIQDLLKVAIPSEPTETPAEPTEPAATPTPPGFELIFAVIAIAVVVLLAKRRH